MTSPTLPPDRRRRAGGFTLVEMLSTVALLIIILGLMVSLARYVRRRSAEDLTRKVLVNLHTAMQEYTRRHGVPTIDTFIEGQSVDEAALQRTAEVNNRQFVQFFRAHKDMSDKGFRELPLSVYNEATVRDAWGTPLVFMPAMHKQIGMAPNNDWFFFSAGPDRQYLTRDDNQYSYEATSAGEGR